MSDPTMEDLCGIADSLVHHTMRHASGFDPDCTECVRHLREMNDEITRTNRHTFRNKWFSRNCKTCRQPLSDPMHNKVTP